MTSGVCSERSIAGQGSASTFQTPQPRLPHRCAVGFCPRPSLQRRFVGFSIKDAVPAVTAFWC